MFSGGRILIVEDEALIALDLALSVEDWGGRVVGPAASVREALPLVAEDELAGAILDVHLADGVVTPVLRELLASNVPVVVQTGGGMPEHLAAEFPALSVCRKPNTAGELIRRLEAIIEREGAERAAGPRRN